MNVSKPCVCCEKCLEQIARIDTKIATNWVNIVENCERYPVFVASHEVYDRRLRTLENMGFLASTDNATHVLAKLVGRQYEANGDFYFVCGGRCRA